MATNKPVVNTIISGPALSFLLFENGRCNTNQEGFLLGNKLGRNIVRITDDDQRIELTEWDVRIASAIPCPKLAFFFDSAGQINNYALSKFLGEMADDVIGWYTHRKSEKSRLGLREKILHKRLAAQFSADETEHFLVGVLNATDSSDRLVYKQTFMRRVDGRFESSPLHVLNLSDNKHTYKSANHSENIKAITQKLSARKKELDFKLVGQVERFLSKQIDDLVMQVICAENEVGALEDDIEELKARSCVKSIIPCNDGRLETFDNGEEDAMDCSSTDDTLPKVSEESGSGERVMSYAKVAKKK